MSVAWAPAIATGAAIAITAVQMKDLNVILRLSKLG